MFSDVVTGNVALSHSVQAARLPPVTVLVVDDLQAFPLPERQVLACPLVVVKESDKDWALRDVRLSLRWERRRGAANCRKGFGRAAI